MTSYLPPYPSSFPSGEFEVCERASLVTYEPHVLDKLDVSLQGEVGSVHRQIYEWKLSCFLNTSLFVTLSSQVGGKINNITGNWLSMISVHVSRLTF